MAAPKKKPGSKGAPPPPKAAPATVVGNNTTKPDSGDIVPMNFKVEAEFHKEYKMFALMHDMNMTELLKESFEFYKQNKGG